MFYMIRGLLTPPEVARMREFGERLHFVDGRVSNPHSQVKQNLQVDNADPGYVESSRIVADAFNRSREFQDFAMPKRYAPPLLCKYQVGMKYGVHGDAAFIRTGNVIVRSDLSCTVFIADPASYQGGELTSHLGGPALSIKGQPGDAVVYPSTTLHEVRPVTAGIRLVSITFIESYVQEEGRRDILYELGEVLALEGSKMDWLNRTRLATARENLMRMWSIT
ncbi:MAG: Fe2+-dependent dioxygenase [Alphaproteobacteria bacterium]